MENENQSLAKTTTLRTTTLFPTGLFKLVYFWPSKRKLVSTIITSLFGSLLNEVIFKFFTKIVQYLRLVQCIFSIQYKIIISTTGC